MKKFKKGDRVRVTASQQQLNKFYVSEKIEPGKIYKITGSATNYESNVRLDGLTDGNVKLSFIELVSSDSFEVGDVIIFDTDVSFESVIRGGAYRGWNASVPKYLREVVFVSSGKAIEHTVEKEYLSCGDRMVQVIVKGTRHSVPANLFKLVRRSEKPVKNMTVEEISKELGYKVRVIS